MFFFIYRIRRHIRRISVPAGLRAFLFAVIYLTIGIIFYHTQETHEVECQDGTPSCTESWSVIEALYFSVVTISTVGYGDLTPSTGGNKAFTIIYIFFGVTCVFSEVASSISGVLEVMEVQFLTFIDRFDAKTDKEHEEHAKAQAELANRAMEVVRSASEMASVATASSGMASIGSHAVNTSHETQLSGRQLGLSGKAIDLSGDGTADYVMPPSGAIFWGQRMALWVLVAFALQFISAGVFTAIDPSLSYTDAFYHSFVTATTVGYGDISMSTENMKLFACLHIIVSVTFLAALIGRVQDLGSLRASELTRCAALTTDFTPENLMHMDKDGQGIDQVEFVVGMLAACGVELCGEPLSWKEVKPLLALFQMADTSKTGSINQEDLSNLAEKRRKQMQEEEVRRKSPVGAGGSGSLAQVIPAVSIS